MVNLTEGFFWHIFHILQFCKIKGCCGTYVVSAFWENGLMQFKWSHAIHTKLLNLFSNHLQSVITFLAIINVLRKGDNKSVKFSYKKKP